MSDLPYMRLYIADYLADTTHLTAEQHGAYFMILMAMWRAGGSLPNDDAKLRRISCVDVRRWPHVAPDVLAFFDIDGDRITQKRLREELEEATAALAPRKKATPVPQIDRVSLYTDEPKKVSNSIHASARLENLQPSEPESPPTPSGGNEVDVQVFREQVWEVFPRNLNSIFEEGLREYRKLSEEDRQACAYGAESYRRLASEIVRQNKPEPQHKRLSGWIAKRGWVGLARVETADDFVALEPGDPRFAAVEKLRGKALVVGGRGKATVRKTEIALAMEQAA